MATVNPDVMIGFLPLFTVQSAEIVRSDQVLKYRAVGAVFLAKQEGGRVTMRVDVKLVHGLIGRLTLTALETMYIKSRAKEADMGQLGRLDPSALAYRAAATIPTTQWTNNPILEQRRIAHHERSHSRDPVFAMHEAHETYTVFTPTDILFGMYIETLNTTQSVDLGRGVIMTRILLKRFVLPKRVHLKDKTLLADKLVDKESGKIVYTETEVVGPQGTGGQTQTTPTNTTTRRATVTEIRRDVWNKASEVHAALGYSKNSPPAFGIDPHQVGTARELILTEEEEYSDTADDLELMISAAWRFLRLIPHLVGGFNEAWGVIAQDWTRGTFRSFRLGYTRRKACEGMVVTGQLGGMNLIKERAAGVVTNQEFIVFIDSLGKLWTTSGRFYQRERREIRVVKAKHYVAEVTVEGAKVDMGQGKSYRVKFPQDISHPQIKLDATTVVPSGTLVHYQKENPWIFTTEVVDNVVLIHRYEIRRKVIG